MGPSWFSTHLTSHEPERGSTNDDTAPHGAPHGALRHKIRRFTYNTLVWGRDHVPAGIRSLIGSLFCVGGVFGFLPILGFWMLPLGLAFIALDIPGLRVRLDHRMETLRLAIERYEAQSSQ